TRAPRTTDVSVGIQQVLVPSLTLFLEGEVRRTDFLMRRRNLNLPVSAQFTDAYGRSVYGTLSKEGAIVAAMGDDSYRFDGFGDVWALDPDGWSEYRGATVGVEYADDAVDLFGSYTFSETTDNRLGAGSGDLDAALSPGLPTAADGATPWDEGTSDFDVPHRLTAGLTMRAGAAELSAVYRFRSGRPFTPSYRAGVDANGDGSLRNDVAHVPAATELGTVLDTWSCLEDQVESFAARNSCRGPGSHTLDARIRVRLGAWGGRTTTLVLDGLNLVEPSGGIVDDALLLVDPAADLTTSDGTVTIPVTVNENFGSVRYSWSRGRMLRVGLKVGG
ncbi:MAG: hypothetical protein R3324_20000, partial [Halobacteriales archaeon]|nr:hypothetical protein [Halobacteriales archaeon]